MKASALRQCQELIGYCFADTDLLILALTHSSVAATRVLSNERLEFLGDAVLGLVVCDELYRSCQEMLEGDMTEIKSAVVSRQTCAEMTDQMGLGELILLGKGVKEPGGLPLSVSGAIFESIVGAIYLDGGLAPARKFVLDRIRPHIDKALADEHLSNYKSMLQQHAQRRWGATPEYHVLDEKGPDHSKAFEVAASIDGRSFPSAWGRSKKQAEQEAARRALQEMQLLPDDEE